MRSKTIGCAASRRKNEAKFPSYVVGCMEYTHGAIDPSMESQARARSAISFQPDEPVHESKKDPIEKATVGQRSRRRRGPGHKLPAFLFIQWAKRQIV